MKNLFTRIILFVFIVAVSESRVAKQYNIPTRPSLIHRVRERLTSILMHNYQQLSLYHQHLQQHYQNNLNGVQTNFHTTPMSIAVSTPRPIASFIQPGINFETPAALPMLELITTPAAPFIATVGPIKQSLIVSLPPILTNVSNVVSTESPSPFVLVVDTSEIETNVEENAGTASTTEAKNEIVTDVTTNENIQTVAITLPIVETNSTVAPETTVAPTKETSKVMLKTTVTLTVTPVTDTKETPKATVTPETTVAPIKETLKTTVTSSITIATNTTETPKATVAPETTATPSTTSKPPLKDPCDSRTYLQANGTRVATLCYIDISLTWQEARQKCQSLNYRLFEINSFYREISAFNYFKDIGTNNEFRWINGIAQNTQTSSEWFVVDPTGKWNYTSNSWFGLVKAPVPGFCLGVINMNGSVKFTSKNCQSFHATFWCEY